MFNKNILFLAAVLFSIFILSSCSKSDSVSRKDREPQDSEEPANCIPESKLMKNSMMVNNIVGGVRVNEGEVDSKRVMMLYSNGELCTAAAIASDVLLTAAHCVKGTAEKSIVAFYTSLSCESGFDVRQNAMHVSQFIVHEAFDSTVKADKMVGDLALVFLESNIPAGYPIYKIADPARLSSDSAIYFFGYGDTGYKQGGAGFLRKTQFSRSQYEIHDEDKKIQLDQTSGTGICSGDSGGPGLVNIDHELQILGVNAYIAGTNEDNLCSQKSFLTLAESYKDWIQSKMLINGRSLRN